MKKTFILLTYLILGIACTKAQIGEWNKNVSNNATTVSPYSLSIGTPGPDGKTEIFIPCPQQNGLVITKDEDCSLPYPDTYPYLTAEEVTAQPDTTPSEITFVIPLNYNVGSTLPMTYSAISGFSAPIAKAPLLWIRTRSNSVGMVSNTRFVVMPDGKTGINVYNPRATLDVRNMDLAFNNPAAIFGVNELSTISGHNGNKQYKTRHIQIVPKCKENGFNQITKQHDLGIFFTNGKGADGANQDSANGGSGLVIAPWTANGNTLIGGLRINANGNVEINGNMRATKVKVTPKFWSDFVFNDGYVLMPLSDLEAYIHTNKHLPDVPKETDVLVNGTDVAETQALLLQKIEELTLYILAQDKRLRELEKTINK